MITMTRAGTWQVQGRAGGAGVRAEAHATGLCECIILGAVGGRQTQFESRGSLSLPRDVQITEKSC